MNDGHLMEHDRHMFSKYLVFQIKNLVFQPKYLVLPSKPCILIEMRGISIRNFEILGFSHFEFEILGISSELPRISILGSNTCGYVDY